jgi:hypothetical protein
MADNDFRSNRSRDPLARGRADAPARRPLDDPLAELARLIGQGDPVNDDRHGSTASRDYAAPAGGLDWAPDDRYTEQNEFERERDDRHYEERHVERYDERYEQRREPPQRAEPHSPHPPAPALRLNNAREDSLGYAMTEQPRYRDEQEPPHGRHLPAFLPRARDARYQYDDPEEGSSDDQYAKEDYDEEAPGGRRRGGFTVVAAVLGLAVLGTAGAFAYRAMFGDSMLPSLPPIIKAEDGPNKIMPNAATIQGGGSDQAAANNAGSGAEKLVPREETPVDVPQPVNAAPGTAPRVVATIPIFPDRTAGPPSGQAPSSAAPDLAAPGAPMPSATPPNTPAPGVAVPPMPAARSAPAPAIAGSGGADRLNAAQGAASTVPKKIHTVPIRPDQTGPADATAAAAPPPPAPASRPVAQHAAKPAPQADANAPLSIVPGQAEDTIAVPVRSQPAPVRPTTLASAASQTAPAAGGGYAVQISSQRSEAEAHTAFRALQVKFPDQLGGRQPMVRRADLGDKGIYYRALVGPFASKEQAAAMCSSLKAAGGNCIIQKD